MQRASTWMACSLLALLAAGCGGSNAEQTAAQSASGSSMPPAIGPDQIVFDFLEAVRTGDEDKAASLLTEVARQKTTEQGMMVAPQGSETARFEVTEVDTTVGDGAAHVGCLWTDADENGVEQTDTIVWILKQEKSQWRVTGMATKVFEDQPPLFLNFEDPEDMIRKQELVQQEMMRRAEFQGLQSRQPDPPNDPTVR